jgi:hypothetical protein
MEDFNKLVREYWKVGLVGVVAIVLLTVVSATGGDIRQSGSSYSTAPNGYGSWYQMMIDRGTKIRRWEKSFGKLAQDPIYSTNTTLLQVNPQLETLALTEIQRKWIERGNTLAILGINAPAQEAPFSSNFQSSEGLVKIETKRRLSLIPSVGALDNILSAKTILSDRSGSVMTQYSLGKGQIIVASTPHIAANAYQDTQPNYELLAKLSTANRQQLIVDEYIHGYRDRQKDGYRDGQKIGSSDNENSEERTGDIIGYLANTPLLIVLLNLTLGILVSIWQQNQRFGQIIISKPPQIENSEAYIQALAGVLRQANSSEFVIQTIGKAEQLSWQKKLGLGSERLVEPDTLINAWKNRTKLPPDDLIFILESIVETNRLSPKQLNTWLIKLQTISRQLT